ncbi:MAG: sugar ABC transporter substrate-binding protein [Lachnospiraceae bacterium]|nr:sugar ABC transporter substrate-binding protein [Lachnospiraceae bacterium]
MKRQISCLLLAVLLLLTAAGCGKVESGREKEDGEEKKIQIGMSFDSFVIERWQRDRDIFVSVAKELGAEVNVQNANGVVEEQKKQIDYFIQKGMDVIVIIAIDPASLRESVAKAKDAGIEVVSYDRLVDNADVDLYISFDNEMVGEMMARALIEAGIGNGNNVVMIGGSPTDNNVPLVEGAFKRLMAKHRVTILDSIHAENWRAEEAAAYIYANPLVIAKADAIMCGNDDLATQAVRALAETRQAGNMLVAGQDADLAACQRIVEGTQVMTVYKPVERLATRAAEEAVALAKGEKIEGEDVTLIDSGAYRVPYIGLEPISVNRDNIDEVIIGSGFHLKEDVYLNVPGQMPE